MKKTILFTTMLLTATLSAAQFSAGRVSATENGGPRKMLLQEKYGLMILQSNGKNVCIAGLQVGTKAGYSGWQKIQRPFSNPEPGVWQFDGKFPANKTGGILEITEQIKLIKKESFDLVLSCKIQDGADAKDTFLHFALNSYDGRKIIINKKSYSVPNANKYGWYYKESDDPEIILYPENPDKKIRIAISGTAKIVCISNANGKNVVIRVYPSDIQSELKLNIKFNK